MDFMSGRILVADDSVTVQKVIDMTLSSEDCALESCLSEDQLLKKLHSGVYDLVVMDFNLSSKRTGVEIAKEIYRLFPEIPVMVMLGTFDNVDERSWGETGIKDKIVKPFNSREFVEKCLGLLGKDEGADANDYWSIDGGGENWKFQEEDGVNVSGGEKFLSDPDKLQREVRDWGIGFPEVIGTDEINTSMDSLPGIIEANGMSDSAVEGAPATQGKREKEEEGADDNIDVNEFWSVDQEDGDTDRDGENIDDKGKNVYFDENMTIEKIQDALRPALEGIVKKYCSQKVEEVAWEVIPDLAENLIRTEIKQISSRLGGKQA